MTRTEPALLQVPTEDDNIASIPAPVDPIPDTSKARELFKALSSPGISSEDWEKTHEELLHQGEAAVHLLAEELIQGNDAEREMAATTLALIGPEAKAAKPQLLTALNDASLFVQANAAATLVQIPEGAEAAVPTLARLLLADDPQLRQMAAVNLNAAGLAPAEQLDTLKQVLTQANSEEVLAPVVEVIGRIGPAAESALPQLQKIAFEQSGDLSAAANSAIQLIKGEASSSAP